MATAEEKLFIKALEDYVVFLGIHLSRAEAFLNNQSAWGSDKEAIQEGIVRREQLKHLKSKI